MEIGVANRADKAAGDSAPRLVGAAALHRAHCARKRLIDRPGNGEFVRFIAHIGYLQQRIAQDFPLHSRTPLHGVGRNKILGNSGRRERWVTRKRVGQAGQRIGGYRERSGRGGKAVRNVAHQRSDPVPGDLVIVEHTEAGAQHSLVAAIGAPCQTKTGRHPGPVVLPDVLTFELRSRRAHQVAVDHCPGESLRVFEQVVARIP